MSARAAGAFAAALVAVAGCSGTRGRDVAIGGSDVVVTTEDGGAPPPADAYAHIARRAHGVIALAEARHLSADDAALVTEHLADELEACAARLETRGDLVEGAARIVAVAGAGAGNTTGSVDGLNVRLAPGGAIAQNALLCLIAPLRATTLPTGDGRGAPAMAIEVTWGPVAAGAAKPGPPPAPPP